MSAGILLVTGGGAGITAKSTPGGALRPVRAEGACVRTRSVDIGRLVVVTYGKGSAC